MVRVAICAVLIGFPCAAAAEPVNLWCARGTPDYPDAHMTLSARGSHVVDVEFVGFRPSRGRADWSLRDCLYTATRLDGARDIAAWLWYRGERLGPREPLQPHALVYRAATKTVTNP